MQIDTEFIEINEVRKFKVFMDEGGENTEEWKMNFSHSDGVKPPVYLLCDDNFFNISVLMTMILEKHPKAIIHSTVHPNKAVARTKEILSQDWDNRIDFFVFDINMPLMSGFELCLAIADLIDSCNYRDYDPQFIACSA